MASAVSSKRSYPLYFMAPALLVFTVFFIGPAVLGMGLSFTNATVRSTDYDWVGLDNYVRLFTTPGNSVLNAVTNTLIYAAVVSVAKTAIGVGLALFLNMSFRGRDPLRALIYMPIMFSAVVIGILFNYILKPDGPLNEILRTAGLGFLAADWLGSFEIALYSVAGIDTWVYIGWTVVIVLAALQAVPQDVIEAAEIDGAGAWRKFFSVRLPLIRPSIVIALLLTIVSGLKVFDLIYTTTGGGPGFSTQVISTFTAKSLGSGLLGFASAASVLQFVFIAVIALAVQSALLRKQQKDLS